MTEKKRAKTSPSFQFYPADWMAGAPGRMTPLQTHVYIWLLCLDWTQGGFVLDVNELSHWCRLSRPQFRRAWDKVRQSFVARDGRLYNPRLDRERAKQEEWRRKSAEGGKKGAGKRWPSDKGGHQPPDRVVTPPSSGWLSNGDNQNNTLQSSVFRLQPEDPSNSRDGEPGALSGARTREQDELDDINRRRRTRGEEPVDAL